MPTSDYTPSDAAKAYAIEQGHESCARTPSRWATCDYMPHFDAGCAHALATVTPRTISTAAELDALPVGSATYPANATIADSRILGIDGRWWCRGNSVLPSSLTMPRVLLVPATAAPEPVRLLDPDDPRIRVGALVQSDSYDSIGGYSTVIYRYLLDDKPTAGGFTCGTVAYVRAQIAGGSRNYSLLAEAPTDPDAGAREALTYAADGARLGDDDMLGRLRHHGYDITKRADA